MTFTARARRAHAPYGHMYLTGFFADAQMHCVWADVWWLRVREAALGSMGSNYYEHGGRLCARVKVWVLKAVLVIDFAIYSPMLSRSFL